MRKILDKSVYGVLSCYQMNPLGQYNKERIEK